MDEADVKQQKEAYAGRKSESTRNPHGAVVRRRKKDLSKLCPEERVLEQWRMSSGCPVSDEAKVQFQVHTGENVHRLADVRLWSEHHQKSSTKVKDAGVIHLEFFFDGTPQDYAKDQSVFTNAFEKMVEAQLQERRIIQFREKFAARRRGGSTVTSRSRAAESPEDSCEGGGGEIINEDDREWTDFLKRPVPATNLSVRALREAGCCLSFLVVQTSLSVSASEVLGQVAFQENFPIDGRDQDLDELAKNSKPLPKWAYGFFASAACLGLIMLFAFWQIMRAALTQTPAPLVDG